VSFYLADVAPELCRHGRRAPYREPILVEARATLYKLVMELEKAVTTPLETGQTPPEAAPEPKPETDNKGTVEQPPKEESQDPLVAGQDALIDEAVKVIESQNAAIEKAETKIISLKRRLKGEGDEENVELRTRIAELEAQVQGIAEERDKDVEELQAERKKASELTVSLKAKHSVSKTSLGATERSTPPEDPVSKLTPNQRILAERMAQRNKTSLEVEAKKFKP
jgi:hypothetical protein